MARTQLAAELEDYEISQPDTGQVCFLRTGESNGAVLSEPPSHVDRIFVNVVPGTEAELRKLTTKYGMKYPRSLSYGALQSFASEQNSA